MRGNVEDTAILGLKKVAVDKIAGINTINNNGNEDEGNNYLLMNPVYSPEEVKSVKVNHLPVKSISDAVAYSGVRILRLVFDSITGYSDSKHMTAEHWLTRIVFLETVAGVPGFVAAMHRHLNSLRSLQRDHGYIHTFLEEAENERMHLLTALQLKQPGLFMRAGVIITQGIFTNLYFLGYLLFPKTCHRFVGYLEEEAVKTYSHCLKDLEDGAIPEWTDKPAPPVAVKYWQLPENANMRDLILAIRADEAVHRSVNHKMCEIHHLSYDVDNPLSNTKH